MTPVNACSTEKVRAQINSILNHVGESNGLIFIKSNVLATLTAIILELELIRTQVLHNGCVILLSS